uniref:acid phosphatase n=1 Tax=Leptobrachium leishanense TaxID=445787 RepID=A0A8C5WCC2_9ANUR
MTHSWNCLNVGHLLEPGQQIYRHGDRSPVHTYINDPYQESSWPDGFGQLTKDGMQQQYDLGQYLRKRYAGFLNETYNRHEVYVRSSDLDRTLMSAQANLAGLFPPDKEQLWNPNILWQPIPVHTVPQSNENLIRLPFTKCPRYIELQNSTYTSEEYQRRIEPYEDFLKNLSINTGHTVEDLKRKYAWTTYDALYCESIHNYPLPPWVTAETMTALNQLSDIGLESLYGVYKQDEKSRLQGGVLLNSVIKNFTNFMANSTSKEKLIMYSAHDTTVAAVQMAMNVYNGKIPPYAACHIFELHMEENGQYSIEMYYRNDSSLDPYRLILPGCNETCPIQMFIDLTSSVIAEDWNKECGIENEKECYNGGLIAAVVFLTILSCVLLFLVCGKRCRTGNYATMEETA